MRRERCRVAEGAAGRPIARWAPAGEYAGPVGGRAVSRARLPQLAAVGDRIVFGSDFPDIPYGYHDALRALERLGLGDAWLRAVCWDNAARLFGLTG
jgi:predicted TIM-barrel fold metal-dependent hydrolase